MRPDLQQLLSLAYHSAQLQQLWSYDFMRAAVVAAVLLSVVGGYLAVHVVLRRIVFVSVALAEASGLGVAVGMLWHVDSTALMPFAVVSGMAGVALVSVSGNSKRVPREAFLGLVYGGAASLSVVLLSLGGMHGGDELKALLWGDVLALSGHDIAILALAVGVVMAALLAFYKEFLLVGFDAEMAAAVGYKVPVWNVAFFALLGLPIALAVRLVGLLVVFAYLVMPGVCGLCLSRGMVQALVWSVVSALVGSALGAYGSWLLDLPTGPAIVVCLTALTVLAGFVARLRSSGARGAPHTGGGPAAGS